LLKSVGGRVGADAVAAAVAFGTTFAVLAAGVVAAVITAAWVAVAGAVVGVAAAAIADATGVIATPVLAVVTSGLAALAGRGGVGTATAAGVAVGTFPAAWRAGGVAALAGGLVVRVAPSAAAIVANPPAVFAVISALTRWLVRRVAPGTAICGAYPGAIATSPAAVARFRRASRPKLSCVATLIVANCVTLPRGSVTTLRPGALKVISAFGNALMVRTDWTSVALIGHTIGIAVAEPMKRAMENVSVELSDATVTCSLFFSSRKAAEEIQRTLTNWFHLCLARVDKLDPAISVVASTPSLASFRINAALDGWRPKLRPRAHTVVVSLFVSCYCIVVGLICHTPALLLICISFVAAFPPRIGD
jgi:hypothetical protein